MLASSAVMETPEIELMRSLKSDARVEKIKQKYYSRVAMVVVAGWEAIIAVMLLRFRVWISKY